ncbi:hypothetical protein EVAR_16047_1 [Eumeta japonica]|uniref:Uncharacterized protein n=1 Tax=Eumeta variegata TaxID=151549 RepID=A0A4C1VXE7_EUMVA|nr:hypothetical protein EVAR_16047_1 [Eumeta japonica]
MQQHGLCPLSDLRLINFPPPPARWALGVRRRRAQSPKSSSARPSLSVPSAVTRPGPAAAQDMHKGLALRGVTFFMVWMQAYAPVTRSGGELHHASLRGLSDENVRWWLGPFSHNLPDTIPIAGQLTNDFLTSFKLRH